MNPPSSSLRLVALVLLATIGLRAQTPPATRTAADDTTVQLSPFVVATERDTGWIASSTLVGSRTNEELANIPLSVDAITSEFMRDLNATTLEDAAMFVANLDVTNSLERRTDDQMVSYRGMQIGGREAGQSSRNFFLWYSPTDNYTIDRIDFNKGSNSLMFGDASPGGQATTYTKRPRFGNFGSLQAQYGSFDTHRFTLDVNRKLNDRVAVRLNLVESSRRGYIDFDEQNLRAANAAVAYRPFASTMLRVEAEAGKLDRRRADNAIFIRTTAAPGRGFATTPRWYYTSDHEIIQRTATTPPNAIDRLGVGGDTLSLLEGMTQTIARTGLNAAGTAAVTNGQTLTLRGFDRALNVLGTNDFLVRPYTNVTAWLEQRLGKVYVEAAYNQQNQHQDRNDVSFSNTIEVDGSGRPYVDIDQYNNKVFGNRVKIGRLSASVPLRVGTWMQQFLVATATWQKDYAYSTRLNLANLAVLASGPTAINQHLIRSRAYLDDPGIYGRAFWEQFNPENLPVTPTFRPGWYETFDRNRPFVDVRYQRSTTLSASGRTFDRLHSLIGVRYDKFSRKRITTIPTDAIGQGIFLGDPDSAPGAYSYDPVFDLSNTSLNAGLLYRIVDGLNLYANYSESFRWQGAQNFTGEVLGPALGQNREIGLKGNLFAKKLTYTLTFYRTQNLNTPFIWSSTALSRAQMEELFNPNNLGPTDPGYVTIATGLNTEERTVRANERASGFESTFQFQRIMGVQARFTVSHNKMASDRDFSLFQRLFDAAVARTTAALAPGGSPALAESQANLNAGQTILDQNVGNFSISGTRGGSYKGSFVLDYEFAKESLLKGTRLGLNGTWTPDYTIAVSAGRRIKGGANFPIGMYASHSRKLAGYRTTFRFGITNLVDLENVGEDWRPTEIVRIQADGTPLYRYRYLNPPTGNVSVTVDF